MFAATPPIEALKGLLSIWMTRGLGYENARRREFKMDFIDVRRAFFHAEALREIYVELPPEDAGPGMCGKLNMAMYGTLDFPRIGISSLGSLWKVLGLGKVRPPPASSIMRPEM